MRRALLIGLLAGACTTVAPPAGQSYDDCYDEPGACIDPAGAHHTFVVSELRLPSSGAEARELGLDLNGDPQARPDNGLGVILTTLWTAAELDVEAYLNERLAAGEAVFLVDFQAVDLWAAEAAGGSVLVAAEVSPSPCADPADPASCGRHLDGGGAFTVDWDEPSSMVMAGGVIEGVFVGGPNEARFELELDDLAIEPIVLHTVGTRAEITVAQPDRLEGVVGGAVRAETFRADVLRALAAIADRDCDAAPACCAAESDGERLVSSLDTDGDCVLTVDELAANSDLATVLEPDVDMFDADGRFAPRSDGVLDSVSLGFGFTAVPAEFDVR